MIYRRQRQQYIFAGFLAIIAVINVLFFFILNRPARMESESLAESIRQLRAQAGTSKVYFDRLEKTNSQLARFEKDREQLRSKHMIHRSTGYSKIVSALESIIQNSGVKSTRVTYNPDPTSHAGINTVAVTIPLEGSYSSIVKFIRDVENSDTFFLITAIDLSGGGTTAGQGATAASSGSGNVSLSLALETYFYQ
jgi:Tfp pilus assembly protein PilO